MEGLWIGCNRIPIVVVKRTHCPQTPASLLQVYNEINLQLDTALTMFQRISRVPLCSAASLGILEF